MITSESRALSERKAVVWVVRALSYLVYFYLIVVEIILVLGFFLLLFGANPDSGFTQWAYRNLDKVMDPFRGIFAPIELGTTANDVPAIFATSILFAMIVYGIVALVLSALIGWLSGRLTQIHAAEEELEREAMMAQQQADARQVAAQQAAAEQAAAQQAAAARAAAARAAAAQAAAERAAAERAAAARAAAAQAAAAQAAAAQAAAAQAARAEAARAEAARPVPSTAPVAPAPLPPTSSAPPPPPSTATAPGP